MEAVAQSLARDAEFVFKYVPKADKRKYAKDVLQDKYGLSEQEADSIVDEVVQEAVAELRYRDLINTNYYPKIDGETRDEQKRRFREQMESSEAGSSSRSASDTPGVSEEDTDGRPEPPGSAWTCDCGAENAPDRAVCRRCTTPYDAITDSPAE